MLKRYTAGNFWEWAMPELASELPELLSAAGKATILAELDFLYTVPIKVELNQPAKVVDWRHASGDGIAINSPTAKCIGHGFYVNRLPREGDNEVFLRVELVLHTFRENDVRTSDDLRAKIREFAELMNKTWYYHF